MILRIEKHFKAEQAARKKAEELLQVSRLRSLHVEVRSTHRLVQESNVCLSPRARG